MFKSVPSILLKKQLLAIVFIVCFLFILVRLLSVAEFKCVPDQERVSMVANYTNLDTNRHCTKLVTNRTCANDHVRLLVLVTSNISNHERRETIRRTWGRRLSSHKNNDFLVYFLIAKWPEANVMREVENEQRRHGDLVVSDFYEDVFKLWHKVEAGFEWAHKYCSFDHLLKTDDDVHVNIAHLFELLQNEEVSKYNLYLGYQHFEPRVAREGRYTVEKTEYASNCYPNYCSGGAVVFSRDLVKNMLPYFHPDPLKIDDAYMGILVRNAGGQAYHHLGFQFTAPSCDFNLLSIAHHPVNSRMCMERVHFGMMAYRNDMPFVRTHYIENMSL